MSPNASLASPARTKVPGPASTRMRGKITFNVFGPGGSKGGKDGDAAFPSTQRYIDLMFGEDGAFSYLRDFSAPVTFKATNLFEQSGAGAPLVIVDKDGLQIRAIAGHHRDAPAVIYRVDYKGGSITFSGDIDPLGHPGLRRIAQGTQLLVFNAVVPDPAVVAGVMTATLHPYAVALQRKAP